MVHSIPSEEATSLRTFRFCVRLPSLGRKLQQYNNVYIIHFYNASAFRADSLADGRTMSSVGEIYTLEVLSRQFQSSVHVSIRDTTCPILHLVK